MIEKRRLGQILVSGAGAILISALFVLSAVSAAEARIDSAKQPACAAILSYA